MRGRPPDPDMRPASPLSPLAWGALCHGEGRTDRTGAPAITPQGPLVPSVSKRALLVAGLLAVASVSAARDPAQAPVVIRVLSDADDAPLANAEVIDRRTGSRALTRENGEARVYVPDAGSVTVRVRQLGFAFVDLQLQRATLPPAGEAVVVRLTRIPFALPTVSTTTARDCPPVEATARPLALWALAQLREGAERYETFRKAYPFTIDIERRTVRRNRFAGTRNDNQYRQRGSSDNWGERYVPGQVVQVDPVGFSVPILFLSTLGDPAFWDHHCVTTASVVGNDGARRVRLSFAPSPAAKGSDWAGDALMDSSTSLLQRVEFSLNIRQDDGPRRLEGFTSFKSPTSLIAVPESTLAYWWRAAPVGNEEWGLPDVVQLVRTQGITYRKAKPPASTPPR